MGDWMVRGLFLITGIGLGAILMLSFGMGRYQMQIQADTYLIRLDTLTGEFQTCERGPANSIICWNPKLNKNSN